MSRVVFGDKMCSLEKLTDEELMLVVGSGNESAFTELLSRHSGLVYGTVAKMMGIGDPEIEDVAQEVFVRVYRSAPRYRPEAKFTTWLFTITRNCVFTACRKRKRKRLEIRLLDMVKPGQDIPEIEFEDKASDAREQMIQSEIEDAVNEKIAKLPEKQRYALILRQYHQLDYEEIAKTMQTSVSSVKSLLFRARDTLRKDLEKYFSATM
ncbi:MAG: RNA polymerase sigma factor [Verrucomicrobiota bacterium]